MKTLSTNKRYQGTIILSGLKLAATNNQVKAELEKYGFTNVHVTGTWKERTASGTWSGKNLTGELPTTEGVKITDVKEIA